MVPTSKFTVSISISSHALRACCQSSVSVVATLPNDTVLVLILIVQRPLHSLLSIDSVCEWFPAFDALAAAIGSSIISDGGDGDVVVLSKPLPLSLRVFLNVLDK